MSFIIPFFTLSLLGHISCNSKNDKVGIIYARVSSRAQAEEGYSLESAIDKLTKIATDLGIKLPFNPIVDVISTSKHVSKSLETILRLANEGKITHLLVVSLDRVGRNPVESLYFIYTLRELGVKIITLDGEIDVHDIKDLCRAALECLFAGIEVKNLVERTQIGKEKSFQSKNWNKPVPFGYVKVKTGEKKWIRKKTEYEPIIKEVHIQFQRGGNYRGIAKYLNEKYKNILGKPITTYQVKKVLSDPVYIGKPRYRDVIVEDPNLSFLDEETFNKTQMILESQKKKRKKTAKLELDDLLKKHGIYYLERHLSIAVICSNCGSPMIKNGLRPLRGIWRNNYLCPQCGKQLMIPTAHQFNHFSSAKPFYCPNCGTPDDFNEKRIGERFEISCNVCGYKFRSDRSINKFLRAINKDKKPRKIIFDTEQSVLGSFEEFTNN